MEATEIIFKLDAMNKYLALSENDHNTLAEAVKYIENVEERHAISRPNPLFPSMESYDNIYED